MKQSNTCPRCERRKPQAERDTWGGLCAECYAIRRREMEVHGGVYSDRVAALRLIDQIRRWEARLEMMDRHGVNVVHTPEGFEFTRSLTETLLKGARQDLMALQAATEGRKAA